ncbi:MAG TPA: DNA gyrase subunit A, partial [Alphaproteobacteria bacterium]|nr:DNA gyrase subunit A [Alphaproteobacteria bacterium]
MKRSYLDYAMSVIVSRALPDVRDGLKPVHRRILFAMKEGGFDSNKPYKKSAKVVGEVMGNYHPHGDSAIYDAMVRMAQPFSMSLMLIDGQGNFGSMDNDPPAAMRYTEARLAKPAESLLQDIDEETVDFRANYDESKHEPTVLPARYPNLLVNGASGIAVGMATNIPPHNLGEVIDACAAYIENNDITIDELMQIIPGPDFPTGGLILGRSGIRSAYHTGRGSVVMRARSTIEDVRKDRPAIIIEEVPYQVNKADVQARVKELVNDKQLEGIADMRDESNREGVRVVFELKRDAQPDIVQNNLFKATALQTSFGVNMLALNNGQPQMMNLKQIIQAFVTFREEVITKRTVYQLGKARDRAHLLIGLAVAVANIDEVIKLIRAAPDGAVAKEQLMARSWPAADLAPLIAVAVGAYNTGGGQFDGTNYKMSEVQAKAILDLRLQRLTGLEREKISDELREVAAAITELLSILADRQKMLGILVTEMQEIKTKFAVPRRTEILDVEFEADIEDLIPREEMVVTISHTGYAKRVPLDTYRAQGRGGKGRSGMSTKDEDFVTDLFVANTHQWLLFFTTKGMAYRLKVYKLPEGNPQSRGKALINMLPLSQDERISAVLPMPLDEKSWTDLDIIFATSLGNVRRNKLADFGSIRASGLIAMKLDEGEALIGVRTATDDADIMLSTALGRSIRFSVDDIRVFAGRASTGVRGIKLGKKDEVIALSILGGIETTAEERAAYLKARRAANDDGEADGDEDSEVSTTDLILDAQRTAQLAHGEQYVLTVTSRGYGKLTSAYEYRTSGRAGQGITNLKNAEKVGDVVAVFTVNPNDQVMLATDGGTLIRLPLAQVRITGRATSGVILLRVDGNEKVVS